jgi:hypothetical protein
MADGNNQRNNNQRQERPKFALNDFRFRVTGERLQNASRPCAIGFDIDRDGIQFTAHTQVEGDDDYGRIRASVSLQEAFAVTVLLEKALRMQPGKSMPVALAGNVWNRNANKREVKHQATLFIGRDDQGVIFIRMKSWKDTRPTVTCQLLPSNFFKLIDEESGQPAPADKVSEIMALSWAKALTQMLPIAFNSEYARVNAAYLEKSRQGGQGGGQGGGYRGGNGGNNNRGGGQGGGYQGGNSGQSGGYQGGSGGGDNGYSFGDDDLPM